MRIKILGSAAAEGWPALFCECETCRKAREIGESRHRTAYLIDDDTLIDMGPDLYSQVIAYQIDSTRFKRLLLTHSHSDHLAPVEFSWRKKWFSTVTKYWDVYANQACIDTILQYHGDDFKNLHTDLHLTEPGQLISCDDGFTAFPILASHSLPPEKPLNYVISRNGVTALIGNDSGWWCEESWKMLEQFKLDIAIIECTIGIVDHDYRTNHLCAAASVDVRDELRRRGILKDDAIVLVNHFSHNSQNSQKEFEDYFLPKGILVGYDGMEITRDAAK